MDFKRWITALLMMSCSTTLMAAETAQKHDPLPVDKTEKLFKALQVSKSDVGVYYIPPSDADKRGYIFDDIPRETITTQAMLTEQRIKKEGSFVKFNNRQISYSLMETTNDSLRVNYYPSKGAMMFNWTHTFSTAGD